MTLVEAYAGEIRMFAGDFAPRGWALCDGQLLSIESNPVLFALLGNHYGGDGISTFGLPDLRNCIAVHRGCEDDAAGARHVSVGMGAGSDVRLPAILALNHIICLHGVFPDRD